MALSLTFILVYFLVSEPVDCFCIGNDEMYIPSFSCWVLVVLLDLNLIFIPNFITFKFSFQLFFHQLIIYGLISDLFINFKDILIRLR